MLPERPCSKMHKILVIKTGDANKPNMDEYTPLMLAVICGHVAVAKTLLRQIDNVDQIDEKGNTSLHCAAERGLIDIVNIHLTKTNLVNVQNLDGCTPSFVAKQAGRYDTGQLPSDWASYALLNSKQSLQQSA